MRATRPSVHTDLRGALTRQQLRRVLASATVDTQIGVRIATRIRHDAIQVVELGRENTRYRMARRPCPAASSAARSGHGLRQGAAGRLLRSSRQRRPRSLPLASRATAGSLPCDPLRSTGSHVRARASPSPPGVPGRIGPAFLKKDSDVLRPIFRLGSIFLRATARGSSATGIARRAVRVAKLHQPPSRPATASVAFACRKLDEHVARSASPPRGRD